ALRGSRFEDFALAGAAFGAPAVLVFFAGVPVERAFFIIVSVQVFEGAAYFFEPPVPVVWLIADCAAEPNSFIWACMAANCERTYSAWICMASCTSLARTSRCARS